MNTRSFLASLFLAVMAVAGCECTNEECDTACEKYNSCSLSFPSGNPCVSCNMFETDPEDPGVKCADCVLGKTCQEMTDACTAVCTEAGEKWGTTPPGDDDWD